MPAVIIWMSTMVIGWARAYLPISFVLCCPICLAALCRHTYLPIQGIDARDLFSFAPLLSLAPSLSPLAFMLDLFPSPILFVFPSLFSPTDLTSPLYLLPNSAVLSIHFRQVITLTPHSSPLSLWLTDLILLLCSASLLSWPVISSSPALFPLVLTLLTFLYSPLLSSPLLSS